MSVIVEFHIASSEFELGRILTVDGGATIALESLVPLGGMAIPLFWIHNSTWDSFVEVIRRHPTVHSTTEVDVSDDR